MLLTWMKLLKELKELLCNRAWQVCILTAGILLLRFNWNFSSSSHTMLYTLVMSYATYVYHTDISVYINMYSSPRVIFFCMGFSVLDKLQETSVAVSLATAASPCHLFLACCLVIVLLVPVTTAANTCHSLLA